MSEHNDNSGEHHAHKKKSKTPQQFKEMTDKYKSDNGGTEWGGTQTIKFYVGEFYETLKPWIDEGVSEFTIQLATYDSMQNVADYVNKHGDGADEIINKVTLLIKNPDLDGAYFEIAKVCPPPQGCD